MSVPLRLPTGLPLRGALLGLCCGLACWFVATLPLAQSIEDWFQDACFAIRGSWPTSAEVIVVGLDDASLRDLPKPLVATSPELAEVVSDLNRRGAAAIGLDVLIPDALDDYDDAHGLGGEALGIASARAGNVVMPVVLDGEGQPILPLSSWRLGSRSFGLVGMTEDRDRFVRRLKPVAAASGRPFDSFALALLNVAGRASTAGGDLRIDGRVVPRDAEGCTRINFVGPPGTIRQVPFRAALAAARGGPAPADLRGAAVDFAGAIVIIGVTARSLGDWHATPYANGAWRLFWLPAPGLMSGPELQANAVATLADGTAILTPWWLAPLPWALVTGTVLGAAFARLRLTRGAALALAHHLGWRALALAVFWLGHRRLEMVAVLLTGATCYATAFALRWRWLRQLFGAVKSEAIARALEDDPDHLVLKGQERTISVLFADIRGFTSFSEAHEPRRVVTLLNTYFGAVIPALEQHGATVDKYMGDGIMVLFGAPVEQPDHAIRAARAAVAMVERVHGLAATWADLGFSGMRIGVGVHTGLAVIGTIGSPRRLDYTAIGDTVNVAARIEAANKELGSEVLLSEATYHALPAADRARLGVIDSPEPVQVKGKARALPLYRIPVGEGQADRPWADHRCGLAVRARGSRLENGSRAEESEEGE